jgi:hypothetical protein
VRLELKNANTWTIHPLHGFSAMMLALEDY